MKGISNALIACALGCLVNGSGAEASTETVLYSFGSIALDGENPHAGLLDIKGTLYGTTTYGGGGCCGGLGGNVFSLNLKTLAYTVLHEFGTEDYGLDGAFSYAGVIDVVIDVKGKLKDKLFGTTSFEYYQDQQYGYGTVFSLDPKKEGSEKVLHSFVNGTDGHYPYAGLFNVDGTLYGTTEYGGSAGDGSVFSLNAKTGAETVLYSFAGGTDGARPIASLTSVNGTLYGTTEFGGTSTGGTAFSLDPNTGAETVLYSFGGGTDGQHPVAALINVNGTLYGTTLEGGTYGYGTVFSLDPNTGAETVLYSFGSSKKDGENPYAGLINVSGTLYGTTAIGGTYGYGTVFSINRKAGAETVVYSFGTSSTDGENPYAGLINVGGTLYGTTNSGGTYGYGTVFSIVP